jgi:hypothetical protein
MTKASAFLAGFGAGVVLILAGAAAELRSGWLGRLAVDVPMEAVVPWFRAGARSALAHGLDAALAEAVGQQVGPVLASVSITVDGVSVHLPMAARRRIAARLKTRLTPAVREAARQWVASRALVRAVAAAIRPESLNVVAQLGPVGRLRIKVRLEPPLAPSSRSLRIHPAASAGGRRPFIAGQKWRVL